MAYEVEDNPQALKQKLLEEYQDKSLEDMKYGEELETSRGSCYCFTTHEKLEIETLTEKKVNECMTSDLKLIKGIGEAKERKLKENGYNSLDDLKEHPSYGAPACEILEKLESRDVCALTDWISTRYSASHPLNLLLSSLSGAENMLFMDIETLGLSDVPLILIGVAEGDGDGLTMKQYLLRDLKEEKAALEGFLSHQEKDNVYVTFNGRSFDVPFIKSRMRFHHMEKPLNSQHLDLLYYSRRQWSNQLPNCRLQTLEKYLFGVEREDDVPSSHVPEFYLTYRETGNIGPLVPIIEHNREDVVTLARILSLLHQCADQED